MGVLDDLQFKEGVAEVLAPKPSPQAPITKKRPMEVSLVLSDSPSVKSDHTAKRQKYIVKYKTEKYPIWHEPNEAQYGASSVWVIIKQQHCHICHFRDNTMKKKGVVHVKEHRRGAAEPLFWVVQRG